MMSVNIVRGGKLLIIGAHSQMDHPVDPDRVVPVLDEAALWRKALGELPDDAAHAHPMKKPGEQSCPSNT